MTISAKEYARRRQDLMATMGPNSIAILPAAPERTRNRDVEYPYRQNSDFWYLTGFGEPEAVMVLLPGREHGEYVLFCRERDRTMEIWNGYRAGPDGAVSDFGADDAFPINDIDEILPGLIEGRERVYYDLGHDADFDRRLMGWVNSIRERVRSGAQPPGEFVALAHHLHDMRLFKSAAEVKIMRRAASISAGAHVRAMRTVRPGMAEYQLEAEYLHEFMRHGSRSPAYPSIVGGGANGCILHYIENSQTLNDGDLVLVDAGCELENYASDITRTFPVNGTFSKPQRALYELVLASQYAAIEATHPDNHWNVPHEAVVKVLTQGLVDLGLLSGEVSELIETEAYRRFFMHRTGHWLGLDVHDVGDYRIQEQWRQLEPGMVLTVEPGLYVAPDDDTVDEQWRGIGIRIEDDVLVTKDGCEVLTHEVPKDVADIEAVMRGNG
ncbi:aminopeptidase [Alcanivorax hongdengensis A-11-3]|uniref:Xaa-Pro aminopeptidase n=1 Tax=Alcanivorax hongdengensis A-11-3 TaxID=1177179 RepID=L0W886_9GAMM|nr:Xaa-Pro aminopeptidase [Alcanivorax hongdengensis]EKF73126.1 aminopeptidase [Alcanivorax hongdengensis A-11-3]